MSKFKVVMALAVLCAGSSGSMARAEDKAAEPAAREHEHDHATHKHESHAAVGPEETLVDYFTRKSDEAFHKGDYERAIGLHKAILAIDPTDVDAYGTIAWLQWSLGRGEEAVKMIDRGLKANPNGWSMWDEAGMHYDLQKLWSQSQVAYTRAAELIPKEENSQMLRRRLAHAAEKNNDWTTALATWQALARDFPNDAVNKNNLARVEKAIAKE